MLKSTAKRLTVIIGVAYALILLLIVWLCITVALAMNRLQTITNDLYVHPFTVNNAALNSLASMNLMREKMLEIALSQDIKAIERLAVESYVLDEKLRLDINVVEAGFLGNVEKVREVQRQLEDWRRLRSRTIGHAVYGSKLEAKKLVKGEGAELFSQMTANMGYVVEFSRNRALAFVSEANQQFDLALRQIWLLLGATILIVIVTAWVKIRGVAYVLRRDERITGALQASETRFRIVSDYAPHGMVTVGLDGSLMQVNPALCRILGYSRDELEQMTFSDVTHPNDQTPGLGYIQDMLREKVSSFQLEKRCLHKSGRIVWVRASFSLLCNHAGVPQYFVGQIEDITQSRDAVEHARLMALVLDNVFDGVITIDETGIIASCNGAAEHLFGYTAKEMIGANVSTLMPAPYRDEHTGYLRHYLETGEKRVIGIGREVAGKRKDGSIFPMDLAVSELRTGDQRIFIGIVRDITERKRAEERVQYLAHYDVVTDLPNRALLLDRMRQVLALAKRDSLNLALMFIDLDKFKPVNDTYGHDVGDLLLKAVATRLQACLRDSDTAARVGGDEFVVLLPTLEDDSDALVVAEKILHILNQPFDVDGHTLTISASIGLTVNPAHNTDEKLLLKRADIAMYYAKKAGKNRVTQYQSDMQEVSQ